jgi:hypothetical protein
MYKRDCVWTGLYFVSTYFAHNRSFLLLNESFFRWVNDVVSGVVWLWEQDEFATLPAVVPEGPIAVLGLVCPFSLLLSFFEIDHG